MTTYIFFYLLPVHFCYLYRRKMDASRKASVVDSIKSSHK